MQSEEWTYFGGDFRGGGFSAVLAEEDVVGRGAGFDVIGRYFGILLTNHGCIELVDTVGLIARELEFAQGSSPIANPLGA